MADPYEVDDQGKPVAEVESAEADPAAMEAMRRQIRTTLRFMRLSTLYGAALIAILAVIFADIRGVLILCGVVYLITSATAYWYVRRNFDARLARGGPPASEDQTSNS